MWPIPKKGLSFQCKGSVSDTARRIRQFHHHMYREWWDTPECDPSTGTPTLVRFQFIPENGHGKHNATYYPIITGVISNSEQGTTLNLTLRVDYITEIRIWIMVASFAVALVFGLSRMFESMVPATIVPCVVLVILMLAGPAWIWIMFSLASDQMLKNLRKYI